jgi:hypothetical protein
MDDTLQVLGHAGFTWGAWMMQYWSEIGAAILMLLQGSLLVWKLYDKWKGNDRRREKHE